jgi:hypothetical protein
MESNASAKREGKPLTLAVKEPQVSVAPEGKIIIHTAIINNQTEDDQVGLFVRGMPPEWVTIESPVSYIAAGAVKQVAITIQPPPFPQSDVGEYNIEIQAVGKNNSARMANVNCLVTVAAYESEGRIGVLLGSVQFSVMPNASITVPMILKNRGIKEDTFILSVEGLPANWVTAPSSLTRVNASQTSETQFSIQVPRSSEARAGRTPFKIFITSQSYAVEKVEIDCILTITPFSQFSATLEPESIQADELGKLIVKNEGNTADHFGLTFHSANNELIFEKAVQTPKKDTKPNDPNPEFETVYTEITTGENLRVNAGESGTLFFQSRPRARAIVGGGKNYSYTITVQSSSKAVAELHGQVGAKGIIPIWLVAVAMIAVLAMCFMVLFPSIRTNNAVSATQTASANQTQAVNSGQEDSDGDGLINSSETSLGTDPANPDTDGDELKDGDEANVYKTNPLAPDSDNDALKDGDEVLRYRTNPLSPDTDVDLLNDGDEINRKTDPLNPDTDKDGVNDGSEVGMGTDPRKDDTDNDKLLDGQENQTCPQPLNPDTDGDGTIDGRDLDPCDPTNPSLTANAPTQVPTAAPLPTDTPQPLATIPVQSPTGVPTIQPTLTQVAGLTAAPLPVQPEQQPAASLPSDICGSIGGAGGIVILSIVFGSRKRLRF